MSELELTRVRQANTNRPYNLLIGGFVVLLAVGLSGVWLFNYLSVNRPLQHVLKADPRNQVVSALAEFGNWIDVDTLVFDLTSISASATRMDVFRVFLQYAETMKDRHFAKVILSVRGTRNFTLRLVLSTHPVERPCRPNT